MKRTIEQRKRWEFTIPEGGTWQWRVIHPDARELSSREGFLTLKACVDDAKRHGYVYGFRRGAKMRNLASQRSLAPRADETRQAPGVVPENARMFALLKALVAIDPADAKLIHKLQQDTRMALGLHNS